jgi:mycothiol system anti-sigma-R factor
MNCRDARDLLYAYADNELDALTSRDLEAHLIECPGCQSAFEADRAVKRTIANLSVLRPAPSVLRERLLAIDVRPESAGSAGIVSPKSRGARPWSVWPIVSIAASLLVTVGAIWTVYHREMSTPERDGVAILDAHLRSMQLDSHLVDVLSTDQHTVKPWFDGKLDFAPPVQDFKDQGFALIGGRLDRLHNRAVAALVYRRYKHLINVFIWPEDSADTRMQLNGYNLARFSKNGMTFWLISDVNADDLQNFATLLRGGPPAAKP